MTDRSDTNKKRIELSINTGSVRTPVDRDKQLTLATIQSLIYERLEQIKLEQIRKKRGGIGALGAVGELDFISVQRMADSFPRFAGMPAMQEDFWEYICPSCGNRTIHAVQVLVDEKYHDISFRKNCIGARYENYRAELSTVSMIDLELIPVGSCAHCEPDTPEATLRLVARFQDAPAQEVETGDMITGIYCLKNLTSPECTLDYRGCCLLTKWLRIGLPNLKNR